MTDNEARIQQVVAELERIRKVRRRSRRQAQAMTAELHETVLLWISESCGVPAWRDLAAAALGMEVTT